MSLLSSSACRSIARHGRLYASDSSVWPQFSSVAAAAAPLAAAASSSSAAAAASPAATAPAVVPATTIVVVGREGSQERLESGKILALFSAGLQSSPVTTYSCLMANQMPTNSSTIRRQSQGRFSHTRPSVNKNQIWVRDGELFWEFCHRLLNLLWSMYTMSSPSEHPRCSNLRQFSAQFQTFQQYFQNIVRDSVAR